MLYLASQSPRRRELLGQLGVSFSVLDVDVAEIPLPDEAPVDYVQRVARDKARAGWQSLAPQLKADAVVIASDTEVVLDNRIFGKPKDAGDASRMLHTLAARTHEVMSAVWMMSAEHERGDICISRVRFADLSEATIAAYVASGEPFGKAGAYAIQGKGATLIEHLEGSYSGVMGLPLFETARLLQSFSVAA
ncbi:septum formation inhibitor Maf [Dyella monticola]|uniref:dTTP/UTP pyrophosphatase n=1 Tax=Dyella monticola TaxID=1927958 RepID=A0A370X924_9GAMM|nr:Maf family protein [Dyella monticola]RDS84777.1 septum formation inhibitor Maf [Dyella monticola]